MTGAVAPEPHWGRDNSDSLVLGEQAKALPPALAAADGAVEPGDSLDEQVKAATGKSVAALLAMMAEAERQSKTFAQTYLTTARERSYKAFRNEHFAQSK